MGDLTVKDIDGTTDMTTRTLSVAPDTDGGDDSETVESPADVEIPSRFAQPDGTVDLGGLGDAAIAFREGEIGPGELGDIASAFRAS